MPNRPGNDDRNAVTGQRDTSNDNARQNGSQNGGGTGAARTRSNRGFASMDRDKQKEIASKGGRLLTRRGLPTNSIPAKHVKPVERAVSP